MNTSDPLIPEAVPISIGTRKLQKVGEKLGLLEYIVSVWDYRHFIYYDSRARVVSGNSADRLGTIWLLLNPLLNGAMYYFIFGVLLKTGAGIENFIAYLMIGVFMFQFSSRSLTVAAKSILSSRNILLAFRFPRACLPIAVNIRELLAWVPSVLIMLMLVILFPPVEAITVKWLLLVPVIFLQFLFNIGASLILARLVTILPDLANVVAFAMRGWLYLSAVFFSIDRFKDHPTILRIMDCNPLFVVLDITRDVILYDTWPSLIRWATLILWAFAISLLGIVFFWRGEESYARS